MKKKSKNNTHFKKEEKNTKKNRGIKSIEDIPPTIYPTFENSGSIITDNEYEVNSENNEIKKEEIE